MNAGFDPQSPVDRQSLGPGRHGFGFSASLVDSAYRRPRDSRAGPLSELLPIENAAMPGRTVIEWDKDDLDALGILKVDCLALGMLTAIHHTF